MRDHRVNTGIPVRIIVKTLAVAAGFFLNVVIYFVVDGKHGLDQVLLVEVEDTLGVLGLLLDHQR